VSFSVGLTIMSAKLLALSCRSGEVGILLLRYCCAIAIAFVISAFVMFLAGAFVGIVPFVTGFDPVHKTGYFVIAFAGAFLGVFSGSLCLSGHDRRLSSVALTILGIGFYVARNNLLREELSGSAFAQAAARLPLLLPLAVGGLSAFLVSVLMSRADRKANNAMHWTAR
jgi:hypothetical protein